MPVTTPNPDDSINAPLVPVEQASTCARVRAKVNQKLWYGEGLSPRVLAAKATVYNEGLLFYVPLFIFGGVGGTGKTPRTSQPETQTTADMFLTAVLPALLFAVVMQKIEGERLLTPTTLKACAHTLACYLPFAAFMLVSAVTDTGGAAGNNEKPKQQALARLMANGVASIPCIFLSIIIQLIVNKESNFALISQNLKTLFFTLLAFSAPGITFLAMPNLKVSTSGKQWISLCLALTVHFGFTIRARLRHAQEDSQAEGMPIAPPRPGAV